MSQKLSLLPLISIIIPTYNRAHLIKRAISSCISQTFKNIEIIVVDDASTDETKFIVEQLQKKDGRIRFFKQPYNKGPQAARNVGIKKARGEWLSFLDSDNEFLPTKIKRLLRKAEENDESDIITCYTTIIDEKGVKKSTFEWKTIGNINNDLLKGRTYVDYNSALIKKSKLIEINLLDEYCPAYQELETHIRLSEICQYDYLASHLVNYYVHNDRISADEERSIRGQLYIYKKHYDQFLNKITNRQFLKKLYRLKIEIQKLKSCKKDILEYEVNTLIKNCCGLMESKPVEIEIMLREKFKYLEKKIKTYARKYKG